MKICHVITRMIVGGAQENTLLTCIGHIRNGHECVLVSGPSPGPEGELLKKKNFPEKLEVLVCPYLVREINPLQDLRAYFFLKDFFSKREFDVVHTHSSKAGIIGRIAARNAGVPVVVHTVHGLAFHPYEKWWKNWIYIFAERYAAKKCDKILAVADAMVENCLSAKIANRAKFKTVYSGMELEKYESSSVYREQIRDRFGINSDVPVIGVVARLFPLKGYEDFVPAAEKISQEIKNVEFLIVGDGILMDKVKREANERGLKFHFVGLVPPDDVPKYISAMDLLIHLSLREGLARALVQALAGGIPAISYHLDGAPEVIIDGQTGYTVEPRDIDSVAKFAIELLRDSSKRRQMGANGKNFVKDKFDWLKMVEIIEEEYRKILDTF